MRNIVLIPCYRRADFLQATIDFISQTIGFEKNLYIFLLDRGHDQYVLDVANKCNLPKVIRRNKNHRFHGNSYNVLEGYKYAIQLANREKSELIYLIEEDIFVGKDFFIFHENIQNKYNFFCVSAAKNQNDLAKTTGDLIKDQSIIYSHHRFQSLGISWKSKNLSDVIIYANSNYYSNMLGYIKRQFPESSFGNYHWEQDGLINRIAEKNNYRVIFPYVPRAFHAGFVGYNRPGKFLSGTIEERSEILKNMTEEEMNRLAELHKDIKKCELKDYGVRDFELI